MSKQDFKEQANFTITLILTLVFSIFLAIISWFVTKDTMDKLRRRLPN